MNDLPRAFSPDVMRELARPSALYDSRDAEILPGVTPAWHVIEVFAHREQEVARRLIERKFGVFVPEFEETLIVRGRKVDRVRPMFPGYIFVFLWGGLAHLSRIEIIPGVVGMILIDGQRPAVLSDQDIDKIRAVENGERPLQAPIVKETGQARKRNKRWRKRNRDHAETMQAERDSDIIAVRSWSAFEDGLMSLDSEVRNQTLRMALGLPS